MPLGLTAGGGGKSPPADAVRLPVAGAERLERSSGAPGWRGVGTLGTGGGGSLASVLLPSGRGAPGAVGLRAGSNASPRRADGELASPAMFGANDGEAGGKADGEADGEAAGGAAAIVPGAWPPDGYGAAADGYCGDE